MSDDLRILKLYKIKNNDSEFPNIEDLYDDSDEEDNKDNDIMNKLLSLSTPSSKKDEKKKKKKDKKKKKKDKKKKKEEHLDLSTLNIFEDESEEAKALKKKKKESDDFYEYRFNSSLVLLGNLMDEVNKSMQDSRKMIDDMRSGKIRSSPMAITSQMGNHSSLLNTKLSVIKEITAVNSKISDLEIKKRAADEKSNGNKDAELNNKFIIDKVFDKVMSGDTLETIVETKKERKKKKRSKQEIDDALNERLDELEASGDISFTETENAFKYENDGARVIVEKNVNNNRWRFVAINDDGDELYDYPLPNKRSVGRLTFDETNMLAKDKVGQLYDLHFVESFDDDIETYED